MILLTFIKFIKKFVTFNPHLSLISKEIEKLKVETTTIS